MDLDDESPIKFMSLAGLGIMECALAVCCSPCPTGTRAL